MSPIITIRWVGLYLYIISDSSSSISKYWSFCPPFLAGRYEFTMGAFGVLPSVAYGNQSYRWLPVATNGCQWLPLVAFGNRW